MFGTATGRGSQAQQEDAERFKAPLPAPDSWANPHFQAGKTKKAPNKQGSIKDGTCALLAKGTGGISVFSFMLLQSCLAHSRHFQQQCPPRFIFSAFSVMGRRGKPSEMLSLSNACFPLPGCQ